MYCIYICWICFVTTYCSSNCLSLIIAIFYNCNYDFINTKKKMYGKNLCIKRIKTYFIRYIYIFFFFICLAIKSLLLYDNTCTFYDIWDSFIQASPNLIIVH